MSLIKAYAIVLLTLTDLSPKLPLMTYLGPHLRSNFDSQCKADWQDMREYEFGNPINRLWMSERKLCS